MSSFGEWITSLLLLVGAFFVLTGSIGLARFPDFFTRLHGPTKATTLGMGGLLLASVIYFTGERGELSLHELLVSLFLFMTAPVSAQLLARAALHRRVGSLTPLPRSERGHLRPRGRGSIRD
jgi:multicomponent K+:H+ antiporter subunit G